MLSLESSPQRVADFADLLPTPCIVALNPGCTTLRANRALFQSLSLENDADLGSDPRVRHVIEAFLEPAARDAKRVEEREIEVFVAEGRPLQWAGTAEPLRDAAGNVTGAIGTFFNITQSNERVSEEYRSTRFALDVARQEERRAGERIRFLAEVGQALSESLDLQAIFDRLSAILMPRFAECVAISLHEDGDRLGMDFLRDQRGREDQIREMRRELGIRGMVLPAATNALAEGSRRFHNDLASLAREQRDPGQREYLLRLVEEHGFARAIAVPMRNRGRLVGALVALARGDRLYGDGDAHVFEEIARRAASAIDNARAFDQARHVAETLQTALLPARLPSVAGLQFDAVYEPSDDKARVGGDWYDALELPDGRVVVSIGDVTGRGVEAAVIMGKVRQAIGTLALSDSDPARILAAADFELRRLYPETIVTAFVGAFDLRRGTFTYSAAGHPPPYVLTPDGAVLQLPGHGLPLGLRTETEPKPATLYLQTGARLIFYTDGLVESTHNFEEGERRVTAALREIAVSGKPLTAASLCERVLFDGSSDDVAVMICTIDQAPIDALHWQFDAADKRIAHELRETYVSYLRQCAAPGEALQNGELVIGELLGNVVRHAPGAVDVELDWSGADPIFHVVDRGDGYEPRRPLPSDPLSESGRGLYLVNEVAKELSATRLPGFGNHTRAVLDLPRR